MRWNEILPRVCFVTETLCQRGRQGKGVDHRCSPPRGQKTHPAIPCLQKVSAAISVITHHNVKRSELTFFFATLDGIEVIFFIFEDFGALWIQYSVGGDWISRDHVSWEYNSALILTFYSYFTAFWLTLLYVCTSEERKKYKNLIQAF